MKVLSSKDVHRSVLCDKTLKRRNNHLVDASLWAQRSVTQPQRRQAV